MRPRGGGGGRRRGSRQAGTLVGREPRAWGTARTRGFAARAAAADGRSAADTLGDGIGFGGARPGRGHVRARLLPLKPVTETHPPADSDSLGLRVGGSRPAVPRIHFGALKLCTPMGANITIARTGTARPGNWKSVPRGHGTGPGCGKASLIPGRCSDSSLRRATWQPTHALRNPADAAGADTLPTDSFSE